ncbi:MAG TPA: hypothetical protein VFZ59_23930 [Verrucomicrobiae bacterium]|nr:hypothetical protein [Verrucomicrobiae bacterium]
MLGIPKAPPKPAPPAAMPKFEAANQYRFRDLLAEVKKNFVGVSPRQFLKDRYSLQLHELEWLADEEKRVFELEITKTARQRLEEAETALAEAMALEQRAVSQENLKVSLLAKAREVEQKIESLSKDLEDSPENVRGIKRQLVDPMTGLTTDPINIQTRWRAAEFLAAEPFFVEATKSAVELLKMERALITEQIKKLK